MKTAMLSTLGLALAAVACDSGFTEWAAFSDAGDQVIFIASSGPYDDQTFDVQVARLNGDELEEPVVLHGDEKLDLIRAFLYTEGRATPRALLVGYFSVLIFDGKELVRTVNLPQRASNVIPSYDGRYLYYSGEDRETVIFDLEAGTEQIVVMNNFNRDNDQIFWREDGVLMIRGAISGSDNPFLTTYAIRPGEEPVVDDSIPCFEIPTSSWSRRKDGTELLGAEAPPTIYRGRVSACP